MANYADNYQRKSKKQLKKKAKDRVYKTGGKYRTITLKTSAVQVEVKQEGKKSKKKKKRL